MFKNKHSRRKKCSPRTATPNDFNDEANLAEDQKDVISSLFGSKRHFNTYPSENMQAKRRFFLFQLND